MAHRLANIDHSVNRSYRKICFVTLPSLLYMDLELNVINKNGAQKWAFVIYKTTIAVCDYHESRHPS